MEWNLTSDETLKVYILIDEGKLELSCSRGVYQVVFDNGEGTRIARHSKRDIRAALLAVVRKSFREN